MEFLDIIHNCLQIFGIFIRFWDFSIRFLFEISVKVYEIFSSDTPLAKIERRKYVLMHTTRVKTHKLLQVCKQVVTSLFTSCQQVVFALLVPSLL